MRIPVELRLFSNTKRIESGCLEWLGARCSFGYGSINAGGKGGRILSTHRVSWEAVFGPIPDKMCVLHKCDNPPCIEPSHLFIGTKKDNAIDRNTKKRHVDNNGENNGRAKLTISQVLELRSRYAIGDIGCRKMSKEFLIPVSTIKRVVSGRSWASVQ